MQTTGEASPPTPTPEPENVKKKEHKTPATKLLLGVMGAACVLLLGGLFYVLLNPQKQAPEVVFGPVEKITIANIGEYSIFNIIAAAKGYFKDQGLDATVTEYASGPPAIEALLTKKADFAIAAEFVGMRAIFTNPQLRILSEVSTQQIFHVVAKRSRGIKTPQDLKGKKIGVTKKSVGEFFLGRFLVSHDLELKDVEQMDLTPVQMKEQLTGGMIDAAVVFEPHAYNIKKQQGDKIVVWSAQDNERTRAIAFSTESFVNTKPEVASRYLKALRLAEQYVTSHPNESKQIVATAMKYDKEYVDYVWPRFNFALTLDQALVLALEEEARWTIENKLTDHTKVPNYLDYIYFEALEEIKPDTITIVH
jgi:NitT/TauT family transport system substrate-binding protein